MWRVTCLHVRSSTSATLTTVDGAEERVLQDYLRSVRQVLLSSWPGWLSTSHDGGAHGRTIDESGQSSDAFNQLCAANDLALCHTKATVQAFGKAMANLVVLECHHLTEIKDADKIGFLELLVSPKGLFGPAMDGVAERFTAAQKSSQTMRHLLPKCSSSAAGTSRQKTSSF
ncbi:Protein crumbs [Labeo rohita]|uniref:Protein crumbs n=1 Tax=Labeo rohita TaxID=84645 RepID=A0ABQ8M9I6_LABRO|nr:Protein crumbs [Labeo rohita]